MTEHKFSPEVKAAILAEVTKKHSLSDPLVQDNLCKIVHGCEDCPYYIVLDKGCGKAAFLNDSCCLDRAHELIKACGLKLPEKEEKEEKEKEEPAGDGYEEIDETEAIKRIAVIIQSDYHIRTTLVWNLHWDAKRLANRIIKTLKGKKVKP